MGPLLPKWAKVGGLILGMVARSASRTTVRSEALVSDASPVNTNKEWFPSMHLGA